MTRPVHQHKERIHHLPRPQSQNTRLSLPLPLPLPFQHSLLLTARRLLRSCWRRRRSVLSLRMPYTRTYGSMMSIASSLRINYHVLRCLMSLGSVLCSTIRCWDVEQRHSTGRVYNCILSSHHTQTATDSKRCPTGNSLDSVVATAPPAQPTGGTLFSNQQYSLCFLRGGHYHNHRRKFHQPPYNSKYTYDSS